MKKSTAIIIATVMSISMLLGCDPVEQAEQTGQIEQEEQAEQAEQEEENETAEQEEETVQTEQEEQEEPEEPAEDPDEQEDSAAQVMCFIGKDLNGNQVNTADVFADNKITMVNLWASWCGPCAAEIPELSEMNSEFKEKGCGIIGFLIDGEDPNGLRDAKDILNYAGASYQNVICPESITYDLGIEAIPTTYFVDSKGRILDDPIIGAYPQEYPKVLDKLLSGGDVNP
ncbi:MAG: TlpA family protein disulfide reductase [Lachnospiraceae bacterium]|nr:TlpA family protein disulfide reductase [Lachnospiraceae bacterium]